MRSGEGGRGRTGNFETIGAIDVQSWVDDAVLRARFHGTGAQLEVTHDSDRASYNNVVLYRGGKRRTECHVVEAA